jgi:[protein-PII] uridylyltransferase
LRVSAQTRSVADCERFDPENVELTLALMDARRVAGDESLGTRLTERCVPKVVARDAKKISARLLQLIRTRHARYGDTLFHLEPNIKECPGGLRDAHACAWLARLGALVHGEWRGISAPQPRISRGA